MESSKKKEWAEYMDGMGRILRFGLLCYIGVYSIVHLVLQDLFIIYRTSASAAAAAAAAANGGCSGGFCGWKRNVLGLGGLFLTPISVEVYFVIFTGLHYFICLLAYLLMRKNGDRLRLFIWRSRRRFHALRVVAWVCFLSAFFFLVNNTGICFGITAFNGLTTFLVGAVNFVAEPEDGEAMARWVVEESVVVAFLVAVSEEASPFYICVALVPALASLWAILAHKITVLIAKEQLQLPAYFDEFFYVEDYSQKSISELDESLALDVKYPFENTHNSASSFYLPLLQHSRDFDHHV